MKYTEGGFQLRDTSQRFEKYDNDESLVLIEDGLCKDCGDEYRIYHRKSEGNVSYSYTVECYGCYVNWIVSTRYSKMVSAYISEDWETVEWVIDVLIGTIGTKPIGELEDVREVLSNWAVKIRKIVDIDVEFPTVESIAQKRIERKQHVIQQHMNEFSDLYEQT